MLDVVVPWGEVNVSSGAVVPADLDEGLVAAGPDLVPPPSSRRGRPLERVAVRGPRYISCAATSANWRGVRGSPRAAVNPGSSWS